MRCRAGSAGASAGRALAPDTTLQDALAILLASGAEAVGVAGDGPSSILTLDAIRAAASATADPAIFGRAGPQPDPP